MGPPKILSPSEIDVGITTSGGSDARSITDILGNASFKPTGSINMMQIDLQAPLVIDSITGYSSINMYDSMGNLLGKKSGMGNIMYTKEGNAYFAFPGIKEGTEKDIQQITVYYHGSIALPPPPCARENSTLPSRCSTMRCSRWVGFTERTPRRASRAACFPTGAEALTSPRAEGET